MAITRMGLRHIEAFRAVMMTGSMTAAARRVHTSQPHVSRLIAQLEAITQFPLFDRNGSRLTPTQDGSRFFQEVEKTFIGLAGMIDPIRPEVLGAIEQCKQAGIRPIMITGDHRDTAIAIAMQLGIIQDESQAMTDVYKRQKGNRARRLAFSFCPAMMPVAVRAFCSALILE